MGPQGCHSARTRDGTSALFFSPGITKDKAWALGARSRSPNPESDWDPASPPTLRPPWPGSWMVTSRAPLEPEKLGSRCLPVSHRAISRSRDASTSWGVGRKQMYPLLFGVFALRALGCLGFLGFGVLGFYGLTKWQMVKDPRLARNAFPLQEGHTATW